MRNIHQILNQLIYVDGQMKRSMVLTTPTKKKSTSNKSKLKLTKSKPNQNYSSSKPLKSKSVTQFRNKSNI